MHESRLACWHAIRKLSNTTFLIVSLLFWSSYVVDHAVATDNTSRWKREFQNKNTNFASLKRKSTYGCSTLHVYFLLFTEIFILIVYNHIALIIIFICLSYSESCIYFEMCRIVRIFNHMLMICNNMLEILLNFYSFH